MPAKSAQKKKDTPLTKEVYPPILPLSSFPEMGEPEHPKLASWDLWRSLGAPTKIVAPMVDGSELAWRVLARRHGAQLCYTPMIHSRMYNYRDLAPGKTKFRNSAFNQRFPEEGCHSFALSPSSTTSSSSNPSESTTPENKEVRQDTDRPLIVQFCGDDPDLLLGAANDLADRCDAVDLNLGCPQGIAKKGHYGSFLQEEWHLIFTLINTLHRKCRVPVTAKMRVFNDPERTVAYAQMLERAGAQIITVHGRTREMRAQLTGLADWNQIRLVKQSVRVPVIANGNVLLPQDIDDALQATGADAIMAAEGHLCNPALFASSHPAPVPPSQILTSTPTHPQVITLAREYLDILTQLQTPISGSAVRGHMFKMLYPALAMHPEFRPRLGQAVFRADASGNDRTKALTEVVNDLEVELLKDQDHPDMFPRSPEEVAAQIASTGPSSSSSSSDAVTPKDDDDHATVPPAAPGPKQVSQSEPSAFNRPKKQGLLPMEYYRLLNPKSGARPTYVAHWLAQPYLRFIVPEEEAPSQAMAMYRDKTRALLGGETWVEPELEAEEHQESKDGSEENKETKEQNEKDHQKDGTQDPRPAPGRTSPEVPTAKRVKVA